MEDCQQYQSDKDEMSNQQAGVDQRKLVRKALRSRGVLILEGQAFQFDTVDIGTGGVCVLSVRQLITGQNCRIEFSLSVQGRKFDIVAQAKVSYCICGRDGFRIGMQFVEISDKACSSAISLYMR